VLMINTAVLDNVPVQCIRTDANKERSCFLYSSSELVHNFAVIISLQSHKSFAFNLLNIQHTENFAPDKAVDLSVIYISWHVPGH